MRPIALVPRAVANSSTRSPAPARPCAIGPVSTPLIFAPLTSGRESREPRAKQSAMQRGSRGRKGAEIKDKRKEGRGAGRGGCNSIILNES